MLPNSPISSGNIQASNITSESESAGIDIGVKYSLKTQTMLTIKNVSEMPITTRGEYSVALESILFSLPTASHATAGIQRTIFDLVTQQVNISDSERLEGFDGLLYQSLNNFVLAGKQEESRTNVNFVNDNRQDRKKLTEEAQSQIQLAIQPLRFEVPLQIKDALTLLNDFKKTPEGEFEGGRLFKIDNALEQMKMEKDNPLFPFVKDCISSSLSLPTKPFENLTLLETWMLKFIATNRTFLLEKQNIELFSKNLPHSRILSLFQQHVTIETKSSS